MVLFIGLVWPEPTSSAAGWRVVQLIELFQKEYAVHFACAAAKSEFSHDLTALGVKEWPIALNDASFDTFVQELQPDVVIFDRFMIEEQYGWRVAQYCPGALRILDTEDLHFLRAARLEAHKKKQAPNIYNDTTLREIAAIYRSDLSLLISEAEVTLLQDTFHIDVRLLHYLPFLEEQVTESHKSSLMSFDNRKDFIFIGNFIHEPNWKTVEVLKKYIWPKLRKELPDAELHIYGAYTPEKALQLHKPSEKFFIKGRAENARQTISRYRVILAPIPAGAGIKGKFVDAMYGGTPSVSSTIGTEGMVKNGKWNGYITDNTTDFIVKAKQLYSDKEEWVTAQRKGFELFNESFADPTCSLHLLNKCKQLRKDLHNHRNNNFIGQMLQHHIMQSTKYMALWIAAKNKKTS
ncbi:MAG TPA: glycosyltransferase [Sphingobacterium sp.]|nr:glycosyltransferase [Sphingobacterium sp.]